MRLIRFALIGSMFAAPVVGSLVSSAGCTSTPACADCDPFATYQDCYMDHHVTSGFSTPRAIEICCIDHPIGNSAMNVVCGDTADTCKTYVTANLTDPADTTLAADITQACADYVIDRGG